MGMVLGREGKLYSVMWSTGQAVPNITGATLYCGLLSSLPAGYDGMDLQNLVSIQGTEFTPTASWYTGGRQAISFDAIPTYPADEADLALGIGSYNTSQVSWANTSGSLVTVPGVFITNVQSGSSGPSLWVGTPDPGDRDVPNGESFTIEVGGMLVGVD